VLKLFRKKFYLWSSFLFQRKVVDKPFLLYFFDQTFFTLSFRKRTCAKKTILKNRSLFLW